MSGETGRTRELSVRAAEAHVILLTWAEVDTVPPAWRERMLRVGRALPCGCGVPCPSGSTLTEASLPAEMVGTVEDTVAGVRRVRSEDAEFLSDMACLTREQRAARPGEEPHAAPLPPSGPQQQEAEK